VPWAPLYLLALLAVAVLAWQRPDLGLALPLVFAPLFMQPKHIGHQEFAPSEIFTLLNLLVAGARVLDRKRQAKVAWGKLLTSPFLPAAALFVLAGAASTLLAADHHVALRGFREWVVEPVLYFGLLLLFATDARVWRILFGALVAAGLLVASVGVVQRVSHQDLSVDPGSTIQKVRSVYGSPDNVGLLFDRVIPVWLAVALAGAMGWVRRSGWYAIGILLLAASVLSYSRGAWAALVITCGAMLALCRPWGRWAILIGIVLALGVGAVKHQSVTNVLTAGHAGTAQNRIYIWKSAAKMVRHDPVFGIGPDNFIHYYAPTKQQDPYIANKCSFGLGYLDRVNAGSEPCLSHPHDEVLDLWLSTGLTGLAAFVWVEVLFWRAIVAAFRRGADSRVLVLGAAGAMLAGLLHGLVDNSYFLQDLSLIFWFLCAFAAWAEPGRLGWVKWVSPRGSGVLPG